MVDFKQTKVDFSNTPRKGRSSQPRATHWVVGSYKYTPCKGKSFITHILKLLPLQGALLTAVYTQGEEAVNHLYQQYTMLKNAIREMGGYEADEEID